MKATALNTQKCRIFHRWRVVSCVGITTYSECKDCGSRRAEQPQGSGYQPWDIDWLCACVHETHNHSDFVA